MVAVAGGERVDKTRRRALDRRKRNLERAGRTCENVARGDQLHAWIAGEERVGPKPGSESDDDQRQEDYNRGERRTQTALRARRVLRFNGRSGNPQPELSGLSPQPSALSPEPSALMKLPLAAVRHRGEEVLVGL